MAAAGKAARSHEETESGEDILYLVTVSQLYVVGYKYNGIQE